MGVPIEKNTLREEVYCVWFGGTVPPSYVLFGRTVLPSYVLFGGTVPPNSFLL